MTLRPLRLLTSNLCPTEFLDLRPVIGWDSARDSVDRWGWIKFCARRKLAGKLPNYSITKSIWLLSLLTAQDSLIDGFAAFETLFHAVPELDLLFAIFPAQQYNLIVHCAGEI